MSVIHDAALARALSEAVCSPCPAIPPTPVCLTSSGPNAWAVAITSAVIGAVLATVLPWPLPPCPLWGKKKKEEDEESIPLMPQ